MERDVLRELITVGSGAAEGVVAHRTTKHGIGTGEVLAQIVGIGAPALVAWVAGVPIKPSVLGAALGSIGSGLYDAFALRPTTFLVWGDSHGNQKTHRAVIAKMLREPTADFAVFLGDAVDQPSEWRRCWDDVVRPLKSRMPIYAIQGNHDDDDGYNRRATARTPQAIRLRTGAVYTIGSAGDVPWVLRHASHVDGPIILCLHRGPAAFVAEASETASAIRTALGALLSRSSVVISGDQHVFGVGNIGETSVLTAGIAGPKRYACLPSLPEGWDCDSRPRGYLRVTVADKVHVGLVEVNDGIPVA